MRTAIIGGGASGLMCAVALKKAKPHDTVTVFERNPRVGKKLLSTGNGRCNLLNMNISEENYRGYGFARHALTKFTPKSNLFFFNSIGLFTKEDGFSRVYPMSGRAESVLDCLRNACEIYGVEIQTDTFIDKIERKGKGFLLCGRYFDFAVTACGGKAAPSQGTDGSGYSLLKALGHRITPLYPSLVQLVTKDTSFPKQLKGIRSNVKISFSPDNKKYIEKTGEMLFTEYGLSGIVSMEISAYVSKYLCETKKAANIYVDLLPFTDKDSFILSTEKLKHTMPSLTLSGLLSGFMPSPLGSCILKACNYKKETVLRDFSKSDIIRLCEISKAFPFQITATKDFAFAQVTGGGADTGEFDSRTMMSKRVYGLFAVGEVLDVDGDCGGYNLNWAWSSARLAAEAIINMSE